MDELIREALREGERFVGRTALRFIVERIIYDLSLTNESLKNMEIPSDPTDIDLSEMSEEEKRIFYYQLADILGALVNPQLKERLLRRLEGKDGEA